MLKIHIFEESCDTCIHQTKQLTSLSPVFLPLSSTFSNTVLAVHSVSCVQNLKRTSNPDWIKRLSSVQSNGGDITLKERDLSRWGAVFPLFFFFVRVAPPCTSEVTKIKKNNWIQTSPVILPPLSAVSNTSRPISGLTHWCAVLPVLKSQSAINKYEIFCSLSYDGK